MDCFVALHRIIRVVAGVTSGSNLRVSLRYTLPKIRPRNDVKCAALSLAALNDFVSKANKTSVHLVKAMPQAAQQSFACFSFSVHFFFFPRNKKEKVNKDLHNLRMLSIDAHIMNYVTVQQLREIISVTT